MMRKYTYSPALYGILIALAMILSYLESLVPLSFAIPGVKLGLANIVTVFVLYKIGAGSAFLIADTSWRPSPPPCPSMTRMFMRFSLRRK